MVTIDELSERLDQMEQAFNSLLEELQKAGIKKEVDFSEFELSYSFEDEDVDEDSEGEIPDEEGSDNDEVPLP